MGQALAYGGGYDFSCMKLNVRIEIGQDTFRGLVLDALKRGVTPCRRIGQCVEEVIPPLQHKKEGDLTRAAIETMDPEKVDDLRRRSLIWNKSLETTLRQREIKTRRQMEGIRVLQSEFEF